MIALLNRFSLLQSILIVVSAVLLAAQGASILFESIKEKREVEQAAERQAVAALDMLQSVHSEAMLNRTSLKDGDAAIETLNGTMERFSKQSNGTKLWVFMGPKVIAYQNANGSEEMEAPRDDVDEKVTRTWQSLKKVEGDTFRYTRPILLGQGNASDERCAACHTALMDIKQGELIGGYSVAADMSSALLNWEQAVVRRIISAVASLIMTLMVILLLIKHFALRPLSQLTTSTRLLAAGATDVEIFFNERRDEIGALANALRYFRETLIARKRLEAANADANRQLAYMASHDSLTGLANRALFSEKLKSALVRHQNDEHEIMLLCIDIDDLKGINESYGHNGGDALLEGVAERLRRAAGDDGVAARIGGDEFTLMHLIGKGKDAQLFADELTRQLGTAFSVEGNDVRLTVSIGIAVTPIDGTDEDALVRHAGVALQQCKSDGGASYRFYSPKMNAAVEERRRIGIELQDAFDKRELQLHYQPLVASDSGKIVGVETLMRWQHPTRGWVSPADFIPVAEATGLIIPLGKWLLETACLQAASWPNLVLAVNVSPLQFKDTSFVDFVKKTLDKTGLDPARLELEITEGVLLDNSCNPLESLMALKKLGVKIAMDDFGTGFSSLTYLQKFPFDKIKIDRSFVRSLSNDNNSLAIVRSVIGLGHSLGIKTTAEGVEKSEQSEFLRKEGCDQMQGYLFAKPLDPLRMTSLLLNWEGGRDLMSQPKSANQS